MSRIGWIGLGRMGEPMARNILAAGHLLTVWNRSAGKAEALRASGASVAATAAGAAAEAEIVFAILSDDASLRDILLGPEGAIATMAPGAVLVEMSTISPTVSAEVAFAASARGVRYVCAPVSGSVSFAAAGKLTVLASGPKDAFATVLPLLECLSVRQFHVGEGCEARVLKLALNMMVGVTAAMMGEALALGLKNGLGRNAMLEVIGASAVASPLVGYKLDMLRRRDYVPAFTVRMMAKDFDLILAAAHASSTPMPVAAQVRESWSALIAQGDGEADFFKYAELAARMAGEGNA